MNERKPCQTRPAAGLSRSSMRNCGRFMIAASDPNLLVAGFGVGFLALAGLWRLIVWVREAPINQIRGMPR